MKKVSVIKLTLKISVNLDRALYSLCSKILFYLITFYILCQFFDLFFKVRRIIFIW
jgi:hypothetical protein